MHTRGNRDPNRSRLVLFGMDLFRLWRRNTFMEGLAVGVIASYNLNVYGVNCPDFNPSGTPLKITAYNPTLNIAISFE